MKKELGKMITYIVSIAFYMLTIHRLLNWVAGTMAAFLISGVWLTAFTVSYVKEE